jgi:hypothetical protein
MRQEKAPGPRSIILPLRDFITNFVVRERRFQARITKIIFGSGFLVLGRGTCLSAVVEDQDAAVAEWVLFGLPGGTYSFANRRRSLSYGGQEATAHKLVVALGLIAGGAPFLVEPVQVRVFVRNPFLDGLPE